MREQSAAELNLQLKIQTDELKNLLFDGFSADYEISFDMLRVKEFYPPLSLPSELTKKILPPASLEAYLSAVKKPNWFTRLLPSTLETYEKAKTEASKQHEEALTKYQREVARQKEESERFTLNYEQAKDQALTKACQTNKDCLLYTSPSPRDS